MCGEAKSICRSDGPACRSIHGCRASAGLPSADPRSTGTGGGSFKWSLAIPFVKQGFKPDSISTDLHVDSMNSSTKDLLNVASKMMAIGLPLKAVGAEATWHPARQIRHEELGNLSPGSVADVAVLSIQRGHFGFTDMVNARLEGKQKLVAELTIRDGRVVYDLNGLSALAWDAPQGDARLDTRWTNYPRGSTEH